MSIFRKSPQLMPSSQVFQRFLMPGGAIINTTTLTQVFDGQFTP